MARPVKQTVDYFTQCPKCDGTGQKLITYIFGSVLRHDQRFYRIFERCPRCKGQGVIPKECEHKMVSVDWLYESCPHSILATKHECDECMEELLRKEQVEESRSHE